MIVDVLMVAADEGYTGAHPPLRIEVVVEHRNVVAIDRPHFVVMLRDLAYADRFGAVTRLRLLDELVAQVELAAGFGPFALRSPVRVDRAEGAAAGGERCAWRR